MNSNSYYRQMQFSLSNLCLMVWSLAALALNALFFN